MICIVRTQEQAEFGTRGEHAIGLTDPPPDQIVNHDADIGLGPAEVDRVTAQRLGRRVDPGNDPLRRGFLISGRAVDLARQKQTFLIPQLQRQRQRPRIDEIVFDRIARLKNAHLLQSAD